MRSLLLIIAFCCAGSTAFAQSDGLGQALERNKAPAADKNNEETLKSVGLTGAWAIECARPAGGGNIRAEFRIINGKVTQIQDTGGSATNNYEIQKVEKIAADRVRVTARFYNSQNPQSAEVNIIEWLVQGKRVRTMSNMTESGSPFVVDGIIVAAKRETPWLNKCD